MNLIDPPSIRRSAMPGETVTQDFFVRSVPNGQIVARLTPPVPGIKLSLLAQEIRIHELSDDEEAQLPSHLRPPHGTPPEGYVEFVDVGRAADGQPLNVTPNLLVTGILEFTARPDEPFGSHTTELVVDGLPGGDTGRVPVIFVVGDISVQVLAQPVKAFIGTQTPFQAKIEMGAGLPSSALVLSAVEPGFDVPPKLVTLSGGQSATVDLELHASIGLAPGQHKTGLSIDGFSGRTLEVEFQVAAHRLAQKAVTTEEQKNAMKRELDRQHARMGGARGPLGIALGVAEFIEALNEARRRYAGGDLRHANQQFAVENLTHLRIRYLGFKCLEESNKLSGSEEPYFFIGAVSANGCNLIRRGPYDDVDRGEARNDTEEVIGQRHHLVPPVMLGVIAMEHDSGSVIEMEDRVRTELQNIADRFADEAGTFIDVDTSSAMVPPTTWSLILAEWIPAAILSVIGSGEDTVGRASTMLYEDRALLSARAQMPLVPSEQPLLTSANLIVPIGEDEGRYNLYFKVDLVVDPAPRPAADVMQNHALI